MYDYELGTFSDPVSSFQMMRLLVPHMESLLQVYEGKIAFVSSNIVVISHVFIVVVMLNKYFYRVTDMEDGRSVESDV